MRLFIASSFDEVFIKKLAEVQEKLKKEYGSSIKWVAPENMHLTFSFLGDIADSKIPEIAGSMNFLSDLKKFEISSGEAGAFPSLKQPRVFWMGISRGAEQLAGIADKLSRNLSDTGFFTDTKFSPHVTLGRAKMRVKPLEPELFKSESCVSIMGSVELYQSVLTPKGPVYAVIHSQKFS
ncbi:MAG: RNA 2',3'-cyclic phosphodiesterase [Elusimicrobia bacterium]|nr:RNA 2',3'-cyclic phosphodiesterase [Elusimicrobiota bacterium]